MSVLFPTVAAAWCLAHSRCSTNIYGMNEGMIAIVISVASVVFGSPKAEDQMRRTERKSKLAHPETHGLNLSLLSLFFSFSLFSPLFLFLSLPFSLFVSPSLLFFLFLSLSPSLPLSFSHLSLFLSLPAPAPLSPPPFASPVWFSWSSAMSPWKKRENRAIRVLSSAHPPLQLHLKGRTWVCFFFLNHLSKRKYV